MYKVKLFLGDGQGENDTSTFYINGCRKECKGIL